MRSLTLATLLFALFASPEVASAQRAPDRAALEIGLDHGITLLREPAEDVVFAGARLALDVRLHAPDGFGAMVRVGTTFGRVATVEGELAATYRRWLVHEGPRGLELGGGIGPAVYWNAYAPALGQHAAWMAGATATVQLDYREHGFFVGVGYATRWLPIGDAGGLDAFSYALTLRAGGELSL